MENLKPGLVLIHAMARLRPCDSRAAIDAGWILYTALLKVTYSAT
ncbi:MAG TPA: hypothetical protein VKW06_00735 [Candidatus Angelobacter sp.]|nr:hypothetical protein [Candidatus Angelobacter sp.]